MHIPFFANWKDSDEPLVVKTTQLVKNALKKGVTLSTCCGNHGEVGC